MNAQSLGNVVGAITVPGSYIFCYVHTLRTHPGNRAVRCGALAMIVFVLLAVSNRIPFFPVWAAVSLGVLSLLLCLLSLFFFLQRAVRAVFFQKPN